MSNSGIDFTKKFRYPVYDSFGNVIDGYYEVDPALCRQMREELDYIDRNKGKFVPVYDDETGRQLTDTEVAEIEERTTLSLPYIIIEDEKDITKLKEALIKQNRKNRKYKPKRIEVSPELRTKVFNKDNSKCRICGNVLGLELAHIDRNPSHTWESNLMTLCSECHLIYDHKRPFSHQKQEKDNE